MAGARAVEEILARGGGDLFDITMFGDEPYGNYNRILLSNVLNGRRTPTEIFLNPLAWYARERHHAARRRAGRARSTASARRVCGDDGVDRAVRQADHRHRQPRRSSRRSKGCTRRRASCKPGVFAFRTLDDCRAMIDYAAGRRSGRGHRRRPARAGGGARAAERTAATVHVIQLGELPDEPAARRAGRRHPAQGAWRHGHRRFTSASTTTEILGDERGAPGLAFKDGTTLDCDMVVISAGIRPNATLASRAA